MSFARFLMFECKFGNFLLSQRYIEYKFISRFICAKPVELHLLPVIHPDPNLPPCPVNQETDIPVSAHYQEMDIPLSPNFIYPVSYQERDIPVSPNFIYPVSYQERDIPVSPNFIYPLS